MATPSLRIVLRRLAAVAFLTVLAPIARGPAVDSAAIADRPTAKPAAPTIVLAQGRCFNGRCF